MLVAQDSDLSLFSPAFSIPASGRSLSLSLQKEDDSYFGGILLLTGILLIVLRSSSIKAEKKVKY